MDVYKPSFHGYMDICGHGAERILLRKLERLLMGYLLLLFVPQEFYPFKALLGAMKIGSSVISSIHICVHIYILSWKHCLLGFFLAWASSKSC